MAGRTPFTRPLPLDGWSGDSRWGWDAAFESFWAELGRPDPLPVEPIHVGPEHLLVTVPALAAVVAAAAGCRADEVLLALSA